MLESKQSIAVSAIAQAVPFPVDFKDRSDDRLFRQVTFPGKIGTYRIRAEDTGLRTVSTVTQRMVNTKIPMADVDGKLFRVKAVLGGPVQGVTESYWLTLHHNDYTHVIQDHNQYRVRGAAKNGWKSDWVYSELKDRQNQLEVFQLLHDILDLVTMVHDDDLEAFLTTMVEESFHSILFQEGTPLYALQLDSLEAVQTYIQEHLDTSSNVLPGIDENFVSRVESAMNYVSTRLEQSFKEILSAGLNEDSNLLKLYREKDSFTQNPDDFLALMLQHYLEDAIDKVVRSTNIEVFLDNGENKEIYLEGHYNFDIKGELLQASYELMPEDRFFLNASSTVKLLAEPVYEDRMSLEMLDSTRESLTLFKQMVKEVIDLQPSEEIFKFLRLLMKDLYLPRVIVDRRMADVFIDVEDHTKDQIKLGDSVVEFDLQTDGIIMKSMFIQDIVKQLILGDALVRTDFEALLVDQLLGIMTDQVDFRAFKDIMEYFDCISLIGEQFAAHYKMLPTVKQEAFDIAASDGSQLSSDQLTRHQDDFALQSSEQISAYPDLTRALADQLDIQLNDTSALAPSLSAKESDTYSIDVSDAAATKPDIKQWLEDYFLMDAGERTDRRLDLAAASNENIQLAFDRLVNPTYLPHLKDGYNRYKQESKEVLMMSNLKDFFVLSGKDRVLYALGDVSETGWPVGKFIIGTNTLKGVNP